jgi:hypothetical protein|tara:strand:- start:63 stop:1112 length:1050 start_codon:yes stop_codon:yes gene_type:complete
MKKVLLVSTIYRVGERMYPIIPKLSEEFEVDVLKTAQMGNNMRWYGDKDLRVVFDNKYEEYITNLHYDVPDISKYDLVLMDDDRHRNGMKDIYEFAQLVDVPVLAQQHGNQDMVNIIPNLRIDGRVSWDYTNVFGKRDKELYEQYNPDLSDRILLSGIPTNDKLKEYDRTDKHILVVVNFLGNRPDIGEFSKFDENLFNSLQLVELQKEFNKDVIIKIKSRADHPYPDRDFEYLKSILPNNLDYKVLMDVEDTNKLISDSFIVITSPSTMGFKSIQQGIPTIVLAGNYGQVGTFDTFKGLVGLDTQKIFNEIERQYNSGKDIEFINNTVEGGVDFNSTEVYINQIRNIL